MVWFARPLRAFHPHNDNSNHKCHFHTPFLKKSLESSSLPPAHWSDTVANSREQDTLLAVPQNLLLFRYQPVSCLHSRLLQELCKLSHTHSRVQQIHSEVPIIITVWRSAKNSSLHNLGIISGVAYFGVEMTIKTPARQDCMINNRDIISQSMTSTAARSSQKGLRRDQVAYGNDITWQTDPELGPKNAIFNTHFSSTLVFQEEIYVTLLEYLQLSSLLLATSLQPHCSWCLVSVKYEWYVGTESLSCVTLYAY